MTSFMNMGNGAEVFIIQMLLLVRVIVYRKMQRILLMAAVDSWIVNN